MAVAPVNVERHALGASAKEWRGAAMRAGRPDEGEKLLHKNLQEQTGMATT